MAFGIPVHQIFIFFNTFENLTITKFTKFNWFVFSLFSIQRLNRAGQHECVKIKYYILKCISVFAWILRDKVNVLDLKSYKNWIFN